MLRAKIILVIFLVVTTVVKIDAQVDLSAREIARKSLPSVVLIICDDDNDVALGSGFFIRPGVLVTNYHVIEGMNRGIIQVVVGAKKEKRILRIARIIAFDKESDLALLSVPASKEISVPELPIVAEFYEFEVGETVYALGNPEGLVGTMSSGIVSAGLRSTQKKSRLQITTPISHGSSGGPIVNGQGKVIGVAVSALSEGQNLNFAVPVSLIYELIRNARFPDDNQSILDTIYDNRTKMPNPWKWPLPKVASGSNVAGDKLPSRDTAKSITVSNAAPKTAADYFYRGLSYFQSGHFAESISDNTKSIRLSPNQAAAYVNRGIAFGKLHKYDSELADYTMAISINPNLYEAFQCRGYRYLQQGKLDQAIADFTKAIQLNPHYVPSYLDRGTAYGNKSGTKGAQDLAILDFSFALQIDPQNAEAYFRRGVAYENKGDFKSAVSGYSKAIELDTKHSRAYYRRGVLYFEGPEWEFAIGEFTKAIQIDPKFEAAYIVRGHAYSNHGKDELAITDYTKALEINPKHTIVIIWRSYAYCSSGKIKLALADQRRARQMGEIYFEECKPEH